MPCRSSVRLVAAVALAVLLGAGGAAADPFSVSGNLNYRENGGDDLDTKRTLNQSYNLNFIKQLSSAMDFSAAARYNENQFSDGDDSNSVNPSASFDLRSEWYSLNLNGSQNRLNVDNSPSLFNRSWGGNFYSQIDRWPSLRLYYNQSDLWDDQRDHDQDTESTDFGASIEYALRGMALLYDLRRGQSDDQVSDINTETLNHYAQLKYTESFFRDRLSIGASQQYSSNKTDTDAAVGEDGIFMQPVMLTGGLAIVNRTNPLFSRLDNNPALIDGNDALSAGVRILPNDSDVYVNIGVETNFQRVSRVRVFLDRLLTTGEEGALRQATWTWYTSNESDPDTWVRVNQAVNSPSFERLGGRTVVNVDVATPIMARYLKVVISSMIISPFSNAAFIAEVEAGELIFTDAGRVRTTTKFVSHQTQVSINYRPAPGWSTGYSMRRVLNLPDASPDNTQTTHSVNASYAPNNYFALALGASESRDDIEGGEDSMTRAYSMAFNSSPLSTLDFSLGYTRTHGYEDGEETNQGDTIHGNVAAEIFPDLSMSLSPSWTRNRDLETGALTTTYGFVLTSSARLTPRLNLTSNWNYAHTKADSAADREEAEASSSRQYGATLSYRPSDVLLVSTSYRRDVDMDDTSLSGNLAWLMTRTLQANAGASFGLEADDPDQYNATINWSVSRNLALQGGGGYQVAESGNTWSLMSSLNAHY